MNRVQALGSGGAWPAPSTDVGGGQLRAGPPTKERDSLSLSLSPTKPPQDHFSPSFPPCPPRLLPRVVPFRVHVVVGPALVLFCVVVLSHDVGLRPSLPPRSPHAGPVKECMYQLLAQI